MGKLWKFRQPRGHSVEEENVRDEARNRGEIYYAFSRPCQKQHGGDGTPIQRFVRTMECLLCHNSRPQHPTHERMMFYGARKRASELSLDFSITIDDIRGVWPKDGRCPILGIELRHNVGRGPWPQSPSLDRIKPHHGYVRGNIAIISHRANLIKQKETDPEVFEAMARWLRGHQ